MNLIRYVELPPSAQLVLWIGIAVLSLICGWLLAKVIHQRDQLKRPRLCALPKPPALVLSLNTISSAPRFFSILALVLRASKYQIYVFGRLMTPKEIERDAASLQIPLHVGVTCAGRGPLKEKFRYVTKLLRERHSTVIWVDMDIADWPVDLPEPSSIHNLVVLNWTGYLQRLEHGDKSVEVT